MASQATAASAEANASGAAAAATTGAKAGDSEPLNLGRGFPATAINRNHVCKVLQEATTALYSNDPDNLEEFMQYGASKGSLAFREALAKFLSTEYGTSVDKDQLCVVGGASHAMELGCQLFTKPGDTILVEDPTYFLACGVFKDHSVNIEGAATDEQGLDTEALEARLKADDSFRPTMLYTIPTFNNPTGTTMPHARRVHLVSLAREYGFSILADEVYQLLYYTKAAKPPLPLACYEEAGEGIVASIGSFSKLLGPGLRCGWMHGSAALMDRVVERGYIVSGGCISHFSAGIVRETIVSGALEKVLVAIREEYHARVTALVDSIEEHCPQLSCYRPQGGYFVWVKLPKGVSCKAMLEACATPDDAGTCATFHIGPKFSACGDADAFCNHIRLSFSYYSPDELSAVGPAFACALKRFGQ